MHDMNIMVKQKQLRGYANDTRQLQITFETKGLLSDIRAVVSGKRPVASYHLLSAHDTNIANWLALIVPAFDFEHIDFSAVMQA